MISISPINEKELLESCFSQPWFSSDYNIMHLPNGITVAVIGTFLLGNSLPGSFPIVEIATLDTVAIFQVSSIAALLYMLIDVQGKAGLLWHLRPAVSDQELKFRVVETDLDHNIALVFSDRRVSRIDRHLLGTALMLSLIWLLLRNH